MAERHSTHTALRSILRLLSVLVVLWLAGGSQGAAAGAMTPGYCSDHYGQEYPEWSVILNHITWPPCPECEMYLMMCVCDSPDSDPCYWETIG